MIDGLLPSPVTVLFLRRLCCGFAAPVLLALLCSSCSIEERRDRSGVDSESDVTSDSRKEIIQPDGVTRLPVFSSGVRSGGFIFLSGALGALPGVSPPTLAEGGIEPEARQAMANLGAVLEEADAGWEDVVKCTVFLADISDYAVFNEVYLEFFPSEPPSRSAVAVAGLAFDARVEVECIAAAR